MRCRSLHRPANPPYSKGFPFFGLPVLHRIAFPVVSEWYQYRPPSHLRARVPSCWSYGLSSQYLKGPGIVLAVVQVTW